MSIAVRPTVAAWMALVIGGLAAGPASRADDVTVVKADEIVVQAAVEGEAGKGKAGAVRFLVHPHTGEQVKIGRAIAVGDGKSGEQRIVVVVDGEHGEQPVPADVLKLAPAKVGGPIQMQLQLEDGKVSGAKLFLKGQADGEDGKTGEPRQMRMIIRKHDDAQPAEGSAGQQEGHPQTPASVEVRGKVIVIGPDGKKREFDLGEGGKMGAEVHHWLEKPAAGGKSADGKQAQGEQREVRVEAFVVEDSKKTEHGEQVCPVCRHLAQHLAEGHEKAAARATPTVKSERRVVVTPGRPAMQLEKSDRGSAAVEARLGRIEKELKAIRKLLEELDD